ncbi:DUF2946 family protein [Massilia sp. SR12]
MVSPRFTRRFITLLLLLYVALQGYAAAAQATMPLMNHAACSEHEHHDAQDEHGMADCLAQCQLCSGPAMAPGFSKPSAPAPHDLTGPRTAIIAANHDGESHLPQQARAPPPSV